MAGSFQRTSNRSVGMIIALLAMVAIFAAALTFSYARSEEWAQHSLVVSRADQRLLQDVTDAETGQRGYLLTGNEAYLQPYRGALQTLPLTERTLRALTRDNPAQEKRLARLTPLIDAKMAELARTITLKQGGAGDAALALVQSNQGRGLMSSIRAGVKDFDEAENQLQSRRNDGVQWLGRSLLGLILLSLIFEGALALVFIRSSRAHMGDLAAGNAALRREMQQREEAEGRLRQAQRMDALGQLTAGVAHDFNNLLAVIVGNLDLLLRRLGDAPSSVHQLAQNAFDGAARAGDLTRRLLAFSRQQPLDPKPVDINRRLTTLSEILQRTLGETIDVETVLGAGVWPAFIDSSEFENAVLNLAVNARDSMPEGGRLTLETSNASLDEAYAADNSEVIPGQYIQVAVSDTGGGMTPEVVDKAFEPFFTTKADGQGTGLGLSQVHGFLKQSRGHIKLYSEVGRGTTVKLYLPRDASGVIQEEPKAAAPPPPKDRFDILIVEDDAPVRAVAANAARELGLNVFEASNAETALACLEANSTVAVMLTDVVMPGTDGRRLADEAIRRRPDLKIIYMTGYTRNAIIHNGMLDPGTLLLTKPFTIADLERVLRKARVSILA